MMAYNSKREYKYFASKCPAVGCDNKEVIKWTHTPCGTPRQINQQGDLYCSTCKEKIFILDQKFDCKKHGNDTRSTDKFSVVHDFYLMMNVGSDEDKLWYDLLVTNFKRRCDERDDN